MLTMHTHQVAMYTYTCMYMYMYVHLFVEQLHDHLSIILILNCYHLVNLHVCICTSLQISTSLIDAVA